MEEQGQRARSSEKKESQVQNILSCAEQVFGRFSYPQVTTEKIAAMAGFSRPNLYRYFGSKEEIFLALISLKITQWVDHLKGHLPTHKIPLIPWVEAWCESLLFQKQLLALLPHLSTSMEQNCGFEALLSFKRTLKTQIERAFPFLIRSLGAMSMSQYRNFIFSQIALVIGFRGMTSYTALHHQVFSMDGLDLFQLDFKESLYEATLNYLKGLEQHK